MQADAQDPLQLAHKLVGQIFDAGFALDREDDLFDYRTGGSMYVDDKILGAQPKSAIAKVNDSIGLAEVFTTHEKATAFRFSLDMVMGWGYEQAHVTHNDCTQEEQNQ